MWVWGCKYSWVQETGWWILSIFTCSQPNFPQVLNDIVIALFEVLANYSHCVPKIFHGTCDVHNDVCMVISSTVKLCENIQFASLENQNSQLHWSCVEIKIVLYLRLKSYCVLLFTSKVQCYVINTKNKC